jgi:PAS domain S-box-containing protein
MLLFGIILVVIAASAVITHRQIEKANEQEKIASSIAQGASELSYLSNDYLIYRERQQLSRWQSRFASFSNQVASLNVDKPEQQALVRNIRANEQRLKQVFESVASAVGGPSPNRSTALDLAFLQVSWSRMAVQSQGLASDASRLSQLLHQQMDQLTNTRTMLIYSMVGLFGAFLFASYVLTYRRILKSLLTLQGGAAVIGSGNFDFKIEEKKNDEIGDLSRSFNRMTTDLKAVTASKEDLEREVTERKRAEEDLRAQREWLRVTLSSIGDAVIATDTQGRITFLNPVAVTLTGWQLEETLGQPIQDVFRIINEKTHTPGEDLVARVLTEKRVVGLANDTALLTKDGRQVPIEDSAAPIQDAAGNVIGVVLVFHDVTEKRRAQTALREAHERAVWLARFPEENPNPVLRVSADGTMLYCNPASAEILGWGCEVGKPLQCPLLPLIEQAMTEAEEATQDMELGGRSYFVSVTPFPEEGYANVYGRDITEHNRAEVALRESEQRLNRAQEIAHLGSWELDLINNRLMWSDQVYRIFGLRPQEFGATYEAFLEAVHPDDRAALDAAYSGSVREGRDTYEIEHRVVRKSTGEIRTVHERCEHIRDASGRIIRSIGMVHDITERKQMEEALRQRTLELQHLTETLEQQVQERTEELEVANEELMTQVDECQKIEIDLRKSQTSLRHLSSELLNSQEKERKLVAGEIHDSIGSSLAAIKFKVESTFTEVAGSPKTTDALKSLIPIVQGAIDETRRIQMNLRPSMLDDLGILATIKWFCRQFEATYSKTRISQSFKIEEHEVPNSLKTVIFRVLQEGLNNIAKHSMAKMVLLSLQKTDQAIKLVIRDNGQGFDLLRVQSPNGTTQGLGLTNMRERTELSGGTFEIESTLGKGTTIRASWPI